MKCIYLRTNMVNGKQYVGQTNDMKIRDYCWYSTNMKYAGAYITNARNKYGTENFKTEILKECDTQEELNHWEQYYIKELNTKFPNGYNLTDGGGGISGYHFSEKQRLKKIGLKHSEETKKKISQSLKGKIVSEESKKKMSEAQHRFFENGGVSPFKGKHHTEESKKKLSESNRGKTAWNKGTKGVMKSWIKGKHHTEESKKKMSEAKKGKPSKNRKKVYQYTLDGELVKVWESATETVKYGYNLSKVSDCCRGERKTHQNFIWSFKEGSFKGKPKEKTVYQYTLDGELVKIWKSAKECGRNGYSQGHVSSCCRGDQGCKTYKGFKWSYTKKRTSTSVLFSDYLSLHPQQDFLTLFGK